MAGPGRALDIAGRPEMSMLATMKRWHGHWSDMCGRSPAAFWLDETLEAIGLFGIYMGYILSVILAVTGFLALFPTLFSFFPYGG